MIREETIISLLKYRHFIILGIMGHLSFVSFQPDRIHYYFAHLLEKAINAPKSTPKPYVTVMKANRTKTYQLDSYELATS